MLRRWELDSSGALGWLRRPKLCLGDAACNVLLLACRQLPSFGLWLQHKGCCSCDCAITCCTRHSCGACEHAAGLCFRLLQARKFDLYLATSQKLQSCTLSSQTTYERPCSVADAKLCRQCRNSSFCIT